jgi:hypothetical protein
MNYLSAHWPANQLPVRRPPDLEQYKIGIITASSLHHFGIHTSVMSPLCNAQWYVCTPRKPCFCNLVVLIRQFLLLQFLAPTNVRTHNIRGVLLFGIVTIGSLSCTVSTCNLNEFALFPAMLVRFDKRILLSSA